MATHAFSDADLETIAYSTEFESKVEAVLKELGANETELLVETDVNILGKIGEFGQPIIRKKADAMLKEFVENIKKQLTGK